MEIKDSKVDRNKQIKLNQSKLNQKQGATQQKNKQQFFSIQHGKDYHLDLTTTEKKKYKNQQTYMSDYQSLILHKHQLLLENQQLYLILNQKTQLLDDLEKKYDQKNQNELLLLKQLENQEYFLRNQLTIQSRQFQEAMKPYQMEIHQLLNQKQELQINFTKSFREEQQKNRRYHQQVVGRINKLLIQQESQKGLLKNEINRIKAQYQITCNDYQTKQILAQQKIAQLNNNLSYLNEELKKVRLSKKLQLSENKQYFQNKIEKLHLEQRRQKEVFLREHESQIRKYQQQIERSREEIQRLASKIQIDISKNSCELNENEHKRQLECQNRLEEIQAKMKTQYKKLAQISESEIECSNQTNKYQRIAFSFQISKFQDLCQAKNREIKELYIQIEKMRLAHHAEVEDNQNVIKQLQAKIHMSLKQSEEETQILKVKLANLREADLSCLRGYYQNQIIRLEQSLKEKDQIIEKNRQKLYEQFKLKKQLRDTFELQILNYQARIKSLELRQHSFQKYSINQQTKKSKDIEHCVIEQRPAISQNIDSENKKQLQILIRSKDSQIEELENKINIIKQNNKFQTQSMRNMISSFQAKIQLLQNQKQTQKAYYQSQLSRIKQNHKNQCNEYEQQINQLNTQRKEQSQSLLIQLDEQKQILQSQINSLRSKIPFSNRKQSPTKINKQFSDIHESRLSRELSESQSYYEGEWFYKQRLKMKDFQIDDLKQQNSELRNHLLESKANIQRLERKVQQSFESANILRELDQKIINIGKENNLLKNIKQLIK